MDGSDPIDHLHAQALVAGADPFAVGERLAHELGGAWKASAGSVHAGAATVDFHAWPNGLRIDAYAVSAADLAALEHKIDDVLRRLDAGAAAWTTRPSSVPGAPPLAPPVYNFPFDDDDE